MYALKYFLRLRTEREMDITETDKLVKQLSAGFEALQDEYQKLHAQHQALERKLSTAREQVSLYSLQLAL